MYHKPIAEAVYHSAKLAPKAAAAAQVVVASKFDNRLKEFGERWEVDRYLSAAGYLHQNVKPFFCALPKACNPCPNAARSATALSLISPMKWIICGDPSGAGSGPSRGYKAILHKTLQVYPCISI